MTEYLTLPLAALPFPGIDPVIVSIGPLAIHWYGIGYVVGILFAWWYAKRLVSTPHLWTEPPMKPEDIDDFLVWAAIGVVLGGRLGYVLFYDFARYLANPLDALAVWQGGMSFHGGFLGTTLAMILFARSRGLRVWTMFDVIAAGTPVGLGLVRVANFINSELWGRPTDVPWAFEFPTGGPLPRHPSQLYEAGLEGILLFVVLFVLMSKESVRRRHGLVTGVFLAGYALARIFVEFFREPDSFLGFIAAGTTMGQWLSLPMLIAGAYLIWRACRVEPQIAK